MLLPQWKDEILSLINKHNATALTESDVEFSLTTRENSLVDVTVYRAFGSPYYNTQTVTYAPRDLTTLFKNMPLRMLVSTDTLVKTLIQQLSERYGIPFDLALDFTQSELNKKISIAGVGQQTVTVPAAATSMTWVGNIVFHVDNANYDLETVISKTTYQDLLYFTKSRYISSIEFATLSLDWTEEAEKYGIGSLEPGESLPKETADALALRLYEEGVVDDNGRQELEGVFATAALESIFEVEDKQAVAQFSAMSSSGNTWTGKALFKFRPVVGVININKFIPTNIDLNELFTPLYFNVYSVSHPDLAGMWVQEGWDVDAAKESVIVPFVRRWLNINARSDADKNAAATMLSNWNSKNVTVSKTTLPDWSQSSIRIVGNNALSGEINIVLDGYPLQDRDDFMLFINVAKTMSPLPISWKGVRDKLVTMGVQANSCIKYLNELYAWNKGDIIPHPSLVIGPPSDLGNIGSLSRPDGKTNVYLETPEDPTIDLNAICSTGRPNDGVLLTTLDQFIAVDQTHLPTLLQAMWTDSGYHQIKPGQIGTPWHMSFMNFDYSLITAMRDAPEILSLSPAIAETAAETISYLSMASASGELTRTIEVFTDNSLMVVYRPRSGFTQFSGALKIVFTDTPVIPDLSIAMQDPALNKFVFTDPNSWEIVVYGFDEETTTLPMFDAAFLEDPGHTVQQRMMALHALSGNYSSDFGEMLATPCTKTIDGKGNPVYTTTTGLLPGFVISFKG